MKLPLLALLLAGCASGLGLGRASVLEVGESRLSAGVEVSNTTLRMVPDSPYQLPWLQFGLGARVGLGKGLELGGRIRGFGVARWFGTVEGGLDLKIRLHRSTRRADPHLSLDLSVSEHLPILGAAPWSVTQMESAWMMGWEAKHLEFVVSPRLDLWVEGSPGQRVVVAGGGGLGLAWVIELPEGWELVPEVAFRASPVGFNGTTRDAKRTGAFGLEAGIEFARTFARRALP